MEPSKFLFFPFKDGKWLRNSQGQPMFYKTIAGAAKNLKKQEYDSIVMYSDCVDFTREQFEMFASIYLADMDGGKE